MSSHSSSSSSSSSYANTHNYTTNNNNKSVSFADFSVCLEVSPLGQTEREHFDLYYREQDYEWIPMSNHLIAEIHQTDGATEHSAQGLEDLTCGVDDWRRRPERIVAAQHAVLGNNNNSNNNHDIRVDATVYQELSQQALREAQDRAAQDALDAAFFLRGHEQDPRLQRRRQSRNKSGSKRPS